MGKIIDFTEYFRKKHQKRRFVLPLDDNLIRAGELWAVVGRSSKINHFLSQFCLVLEQQNLPIMQYPVNNLFEPAPEIKTRIKPKQILKEILRINESGIVIINSPLALKPDYEKSAKPFDQNSFDKVSTALGNIMKITHWAGIMLFRKDIPPKEAKFCQYLAEYRIKKRYSGIYYLEEGTEAQKGQNL